MCAPMTLGPGVPAADAVESPDCGCAAVPCAPCVAQLGSQTDRLAALRAAIELEPEPLVTLTHLLHLCRDEHPLLREQFGVPASRARVGAVVAGVAAAVGPRPASTLGMTVRRALADALDDPPGLAPVMVAYGLAQFLDDRYGHTFTDSFRRRSPYQPAVGDPVPLNSPDLRSVVEMRPTSPPWRLANRLDQTRQVRLAGGWASQFRVIFDYDAFDCLAGLVSSDTVVATCHPNRDLSDFGLPPVRSLPAFPVAPLYPARQHRELDRLIGRAVAAGASVVVLPELSVTEAIAEQLADWVRRPGPLRLLVAGSYHHVDVDTGGRGRHRNTAIAWVRGHDQPLTQDKHSPADRPVVEDIQPQGWPELRVHVTADGWHLAMAICRDLLNPEALHTLSEVGANLTLVPAMSETLVPFGGPVAHLVGCTQGFVAVANNPADWSDAGRGWPGHPARAVFGHPGFGQQIRLVTSADLGPGVATLHVGSGQVGWIPFDPLPVPTRRQRLTRTSATRCGTAPGWVAALAGPADAPLRSVTWGPRPLSLRPAAVLVLLTDGPAGPEVLLTERASDLGDYPSVLVFPGGAAEATDEGPLATALREATEEVGLLPASVEVFGTLAPLALPESGFMVTPVLAWSAHPAFSGSLNQAEVASLRHMPLGPPQPAADPGGGAIPEDGCRAPGLGGAQIGRMTAAVIDLLRGRLVPAAPWSSEPPAQERAKETDTWCQGALP